MSDLALTQDVDVVDILQMDCHAQDVANLKEKQGDFMIDNLGQYIVPIVIASAVGIFIGTRLWILFKK
ncbi:MAG: hypothetical protein DWQ18_08920 [Crenarchaeota archaeon]|nr:MAG: hypothetical protein DWQ17_00865 [Thermoproteota archaeon]RDJ33257.1 MAG: hypothetical protein DWQ18_08920 [Thermoproteota archaeon]RDJ36240.1 MAG: hypothetical protein DWQ19_06400 [Thermoproteota archaeon]RDJ38870.1 MAG: hypothetical protein DWQ13_00865 [Thermoproteota archaeon]